jgi:glutathionyl-hydroquinone reductase
MSAVTKEHSEPHTPANIYSWANKEGSYKRQVSSFRSQIEENGEFPPEAGRYRLYVSLACPWANRILIARNLKGLQDVIDVCVVDHFMGPDGCMHQLLNFREIHYIGPCSWMLS